MTKQEYIERIVKEEMDNVPEPCRVKGPYICYILRSVVAPARTYSGSTNDFLHRIRQHNGLLAGGAVMTKTSRPWRVAALIYGFSTRSAALRYEWFTKMKHSKTWNIAAKQGKNALQRRAALMMTAELRMKPEERKRLCYYLPDYYVRRCVDEARSEGVPGTLDAIFHNIEQVILETKPMIKQDPMTMETTQDQSLPITTQDPITTEDPPLQDTKPIE